MAELSVSERDAGDDEAPAPLAITPTGEVDRWALLVGVSRYADETLSLKFAARDAQKLRETLLEPTSGAFPDDHVHLLVDEDATLAGLTKALRTFLKQPAPEDLVVVFLACHGSRDRERPDNLYLLPYDTDPADISGTALPMREVEQALRETLLSTRVVVLVDACHSGGLGGQFADVRAAHDDAADLNTYLNMLSSSRGGVSLMTSAMASESSVEGERWGDGHGVFTHFLLEGLRGRADQPPYDGIVTVGELFDFVQDRVKEATARRQHPHISPDADRALALAVTGSLSGTQHLELAGRLAGAAELLGEPTCWRGAAVQYSEAIRLLGEPAQAESCVDHALALYRAGDPAGAEAVLRGAVDGDARARLVRGLLQLAGGRADDARTTLLDPKPVEPWAPKLFSTSLPRARRVALLVGLDVVDPAAFGGWDGQLASCVAETDALADVLERRFGFDEQVRLVDDKATAAAFLDALEQVVEDSASCDALVVSFSGHGGRQPVPGDGRQEGTLVAFDGEVPAADVDAILRRSAAGRTTLIASTAHSGAFGDYATAGGYEALCSCQDLEVDRDGPRLGAFFEALLPNLKPDVDGGTVERATAAALGDTLDTQHPVFAADPRRPLLAGDDGGSRDGGPIAARVRLGGTAAVSSDTLEQIADLVAEGELPMSFAPTIACEWWRRGELDRLAAAPLASSPATLALACASAAAAARGSSATSLPKALRQLERRPLVSDEPELRDQIRELVRRTKGKPLADDRLRAVLVGVSSLGPGVPGMRIASDGVAAVHAALLDRGVAPEHVTVLVGEEATENLVKHALHRAWRQRRDGPVFVYWCGPGSVLSMDCFDGGKVSQGTVAFYAGATATLVAEGPKAAPPDLSSGPVPSGPRLTLLSVRAAGKKRPAGSVSRDRLDGRPGKARYGRLTIALVEALREARDLTDIPASAIGGPHDRTTAALQPADDVFLLDPLVSRVDAVVARVRALELAATAGAVSRLLERRNGVDPEALLQLGILRGSLGETGEAVDALERAIQQFGADAGGEARARLHLGHVLLDSGLDRARAVSECRTATVRDPSLVEAWYWLGRAIAELIERETAAEASTALRTYVARGAPQGRRSEVRRLLDAMAGKAAGPGAGR